MSEPHTEPQAADVRSFLPRPGEPVEDYAARLRALHHDLTLVLDAVERGLAAAERSPVRDLAPVAEPDPVGAVAEPHPEPHRSPAPFDPLPGSRGGARVEVVTTGRQQASSGPPAPGGTPWGGRRAPEGERAPVEPAVLSPERPPWVELPPHPPRQGRWVESDDWGAPPRQQPAPWPERRSSSWPAPPPPPAEMSFDPPYGVSRRRPRLEVSSLVVAATILGWLTVVALILALALD